MLVGCRLDQLVLRISGTRSFCQANTFAPPRCFPPQFSRVPGSLQPPLHPSSLLARPIPYSGLPSNFNDFTVEQLQEFAMNSQKTVNTMQAASIVNQGQASTDQTGGQPSTAVPQPDDVQELARKLQEANLNPASDQRPSIPGTTPVDVLRGNPALGSAADQLLAQVYQRAPWLYPGQTLPGLPGHGLNLAASGQPLLQSYAHTFIGYNATTLPVNHPPPPLGNNAPPPGATAPAGSVPPLGASLPPSSSPSLLGTHGGIPTGSQPGLSLFDVNNNTYQDTWT